VETEDDSHVCLTHEGATTHVILPVDTYDRLVKSEMALHAIQQIERGEDESRDWIDADDFAIELARDAIVAARKAAGLTQKQLGARIGVPQSQISRIERNPDRTTVRTLKRLAKALRVNVSAFI
jgi:ribosome-binding protein aMBF1 (putative translation factor)